MARRRRSPNYFLEAGTDMSDLQKAEFITGGFTLWTPPPHRSHRLVLGYEIRCRGELLALTSQVDQPGPFDELEDVSALVVAYVERLFGVAAAYGD